MEKKVVSGRWKYDPDRGGGTEWLEEQAFNGIRAEERSVVR